MVSSTNKSLREIIYGLKVYDKRLAVGCRAEFGLRKWSYNMLHLQSYNFASQFQKYGIRKGDNILLVVPNCPEAVACLLGAALLGITVVPLDESSSDVRINEVAEDVKAKLIVYDALERSINTTIESIDILNITKQCITDPIVDLSEDVDGETIALILYTSGTTNTQKGVIVTHGNIMSALIAYTKWNYLLRIIQVRVLCLVPISRIFGAMMGVYLPLFIGLSIIYTRVIEPAHICRVVHDNRVTMLVASPRMLALISAYLLHTNTGRGNIKLIDKIRSVHLWILKRHYMFLATRKHTGYRLSVIIVGGAVISREEEEFWFDSGYKLVQGYGSTETTAFSTVNSPIFGKRGSIGKVIKNSDYMVTEQGELLVKGPTITPGYYHKGKVVKHTDNNGYYNTGDLVSMDENNNIYYQGRKNELIVTAEGYNVFPTDIEAVINQQPEINDSVVFGLIDDKKMEQVHAVLLLNKSHNGNELDIIRRVNTLLEKHQMISSWTVWPGDDFPRGTLLKAKKSEIKRLVQQGINNETHGINTKIAPELDDIFQEKNKDKRIGLIAKYIYYSGANAKESKNTISERFSLNSIDMAQLLLNLEELSGRKLSFNSVNQSDINNDGSLLNETLLVEYNDIPDIKPPLWSESKLVYMIGMIYRKLLLTLYFRQIASISSHNSHKLYDIQGPFILAAKHHEHALDVITIYLSLPKGLRKPLMIVASDWAFGAYLKPTIEHSNIIRYFTRFMFKAGLPAFFPFVVMPHSGGSMSGLMDTGRMIDKGYSPVIFPERFLNTGNNQNQLHPGFALLALQNQIPVIPVSIKGNEAIQNKLFSVKSNISICYGKPINVTPDLSRDDLIAALHDEFSHMP